MRRSIVFSILTATTVLLAGCTDDGGDSTTSAPVSPLSSQTTSDATKPSPEKPSKATKKTEEKPTTAAAEVKIVDPAAFTPPGPDGANSRIFVLQDGVTECFMNSLSGDAYMTCRTNLVDPPVVQDFYGTDTPANAVSWNPSGVTFETMQFPSGYPSATLNPGERLESFGFSCTATGAASVGCSGPTGQAVIDGGKVTGAKVPPRKEKTPAPEPGPAPTEGPVLPELPEVQLPTPEEIINGLQGQN